LISPLRLRRPLRLFLQGYFYLDRPKLHAPALAIYLHSLYLRTAPRWTRGQHTTEVTWFLLIRDAYHRWCLPFCHFLSLPTRYPTAKIIIKTAYMAGSSGIYLTSKLQGGGSNLSPVVSRYCSCRSEMRSSNQELPGFIHRSV